MHCIPPPLFYCMLYQHTVTQWNSLQIRDPALNIQSQMVRRDAFEVHLLPGVNGDVSPLTTCDQINQNANKTRCKGASVWKTVSLFPIPQDAGRWVKPPTSDKQKSPHSNVAHTASCPGVRDRWTGRVHVPHTFPFLTMPVAALPK